MHIESDIKLGFKDVMLRPKRSTLSSRSEVSLIRKFKFLHSGNTWEGIPIMAANMDTTGTMEMAKVLASHQLFTAIHKHYTRDQWKTFMKTGGESIIEHMAVSTGTSSDDARNLDHILKENTSVRFICIDVANGYAQNFVTFVKSTRNNVGGANTVRGYRERRIGPRDLGNREPIGGEAFWVVNVEETFPIFPNLIKGAVFFDSGNAYETVGDFGSGGTFSGVGAGVRIKTPIGPVKLDMGYPLDEIPEEDKIYTAQVICQMSWYFLPLKCNFFFAATQKK